MTPEQERACLVHAGRLIEAGWIGMRASMHPDAPAEQIYEMRLAFFAGAHHLFFNIVAAARRDDDNNRETVTLGMIDRELHEFADEYRLYNAPTAGNA
jgi:hypothetical protein